MSLNQDMFDFYIPPHADETPTLPTEEYIAQLLQYAIDEKAAHDAFKGMIDGILAMNDIEIVYSESQEGVGWRVFRSFDAMGNYPILGGAYYVRRDDAYRDALKFITTS